MPKTLFHQSCRPETCNFIKKETLAQVFSSRFCQISKNTFYKEQLWWLLSNGDIHRSLKCCIQNFKNLSEKYKNIKSTYPIKQIYRQKERPGVLDNFILLKRYRRLLQKGFTCLIDKAH